MRIISGQWKGRRLNPPKNITARPTTDFAKESLFNLLQNRIQIEGSNVLDLFAGTGSISLECASRGKNLTVVRGDVFKFVPSCRTKFDLIFADPPYQLDKLPTLPDLIFSHEMLAEGGWFVLEHSANNSFQEHPHFVEERKYGNVHFSFFQ